MEVTVSTTTIVQGESAEILLENKGGTAVNLRMQAKSSTPPLFISDRHGALGFLIFRGSPARFGLQTTAAFTAEAVKNEDIGTHVSRDFLNLQPINENTLYEMEFSSEENVNFRYRGASHGAALTLHFTIIHVPETIRLRVRVYLEGALPRR